MAAPTPQIDSPLRFLSPRVSVSMRLVQQARSLYHSSLETPPVRVIRGCVLVSHVPGSRIGLLSQPVRDFDFPATLMGFTYPSQLCSASRLRPSFNARNPRAVLPCAWPRVSSSRDLRQVLAHIVWRSAAASGVWPREAAVPCYLPAPPWLLCIGPIEFTCRCCPGF
jgi:hypothetical protein